MLAILEKIACPKPIEKVLDEPTETTGDGQSAGATAPAKKKNKKDRRSQLAVANLRLHLPARRWLE